VNLVAFFQQQIGQITSILAGDPGDQARCIWRLALNQIEHSEQIIVGEGRALSRPKHLRTTRRSSPPLGRCRNRQQRDRVPLRRDQNRGFPYVRAPSISSNCPCVKVASSPDP
jgi:hypothetical protein